MKSLITKVADNTTYAVLLLTGLSIFFYIGLGLVPLFDWDEINFAESAREMIMSGDYMKVQINYTPFWEKPPLFFWLQVCSMKLFGIHAFAARLPNAIFGTLYMLTFYFIGKKHFSGSMGLLWGLLYAGSLLPHLYFKTGIIDPVFNYFIFMSVYCMMLVFGRYRHSQTFAILSGVFSALSVLTKGPVGLLLLALSAGVYAVVKKFSNFPSFRNLLLFALGFVLLVSSWLSVEFYQNGTENMIKFIVYQIELFNTPVAGHDQPFYYHFIVVFLGCFPLSVFSLPVLSGYGKETSAFDFRLWMKVLFWVVMILFSLSTTKIIHYSSMTYIPLSFLGAWYFDQVMTGQLQWKKYLSYLFLFLGLFWSFIFVIIPYIFSKPDIIIPYIKDPFAVDSLGTKVSWSGMEWMVGLLLFIGVLYSFYCLRHTKVLHAVLSMVVSLSVTLMCTNLFVLPKIENIVQGPVVRFYESVRDEDAYFESYGYKSYAQYFYAKQPFGTNDKRKDREWLLSGDIDKPVYLVSKSTNRELDSHPGFSLIKAEGGFRMYRRESVK